LSRAVNRKGPARPGPAAHIRHAGRMIDASFRPKSNGMIVDYYVVQGSKGRFYSLAVAEEIAEGLAK